MPKLSYAIALPPVLILAVFFFVRAAEGRD